MIETSRIITITNWGGEEISKEAIFSGVPIPKDSLTLIYIQIGKKMVENGQAANTELQKLLDGTKKITERLDHRLNGYKCGEESFWD